MAEQTEYIIHVVNDANKESGAPVSNAGTGTQPDTAGDGKNNSTSSLGGVMAQAKKIVSVGTAGMIADKLVSYQINTVSLRTGANEYEQKLQYGYSALKQTVLPIAAGAVMGGLPGVIIGGLFSLGMQAIGWAQNAQTIEYNRQLENFSITMASERAGWSGSRSNRQ